MESLEKIMLFVAKKLKMTDVMVRKGIFISEMK